VGVMREWWVGKWFFPSSSSSSCFSSVGRGGGGGGGGGGSGTPPLPPSTHKHCKILWVAKPRQDPLSDRKFATFPLSHLKQYNVIAPPMCSRCLVCVYIRRLSLSLSLCVHTACFPLFVVISLVGVSMRQFSFCPSLALSLTHASRPLLK